MVCTAGSWTADPVAQVCGSRVVAAVWLTEAGVADNHQMTGSPRILRPTLRLGSLAITLAATTLAAAAVTVPAASASTQESPWGPAKTLARGQLSPSLQQTTGRTGNTVLVFRTTPHGSPSQVQVVDQVDGTWSTPASVSTKKVFRPTVTAWGAGNIAVIWQSKAGVNSWRFHLRNLNPNGSWQPEQILTTARHAYPWYQAAITTKGRVALAWVDATTPTGSVSSSATARGSRPLRSPSCIRRTAQRRTSRTLSRSSLTTAAVSRTSRGAPSTDPGAPSG